MGSVGVVRSNAWDLALLIHAEHDRVLRRRQVEADDVGDLGDQLGIGGFERLGPPGRHPGLTPDRRDRAVTDSKMPTQQPLNAL